MTPAVKLKQAIDKTIKEGPEVKFSVLRHRAEDYDEPGGMVRLVRAGERVWYGEGVLLDSQLVETGGKESAILADAISRAGRRR